MLSTQHASPSPYAHEVRLGQEFLSICGDTSNVIRKSYLQSIAKQDVQKYCAINFQCSYLLCRKGEGPGLPKHGPGCIHSPSHPGITSKRCASPLCLYIPTEYYLRHLYIDLQTFFCEYGPDF